MTRRELREHNDMTQFTIVYDYIGVTNLERFEKDEIVQQVKKHKSGKQAGPDEIKAEIMKCMVEDETCTRMLEISTNNLLNDSNPPRGWES